MSSVLPARPLATISWALGVAGAIAIMLLAAGCGSEPQDTQGSPGERVRAALAREGVPGLAIATLKDCSVDTIETFGVADVQAGHAVTETTLFEAASLSKQVFAYLYLRAVDRGVVSLDEPLAKKFDYPRASQEQEYATLTARHILIHRSGLPNWAREDEATGKRGPLKFKREPGAAFTYSGEGFQMLQAYLEARTGSTLETLFAEALAQDMPMSAFWPTVPPGVAVANGYRADGTVNLERPLEEHDALSLRTVVTDYARFAERLCRGTGLSKEVWSEMLRPQSPAPAPLWRRVFAPTDAEVSWGAGLGVLQAEGRQIHFQWGDNGVFKNLLAFDRETGAGFVYFTNGENGLELMETVGDPILGMSLQPLRRWLR